MPEHLYSALRDEYLRETDIGRKISLGVRMLQTTEGRAKAAVCHQEPEQMIWMAEELFRKCPSIKGRFDRTRAETEQDLELRSRIGDLLCNTGMFMASE